MDSKADQGVDAGRALTAAEPPTFTPEENALAEKFDYLDDLRESGVTNMYGAGPYVQEEFGLDRKEARDVVIAWMRTFSNEHDAGTRARAALTKSGGKP